MGEVPHRNGGEFDDGLKCPSHTMEVSPFIGLISNPLLSLVKKLSVVKLSVAVSYFQNLIHSITSNRHT